jgi:HEAT repeat protein
MGKLSLDEIVEKLRNEDSRWDAILELKLLTDPKWIDPLTELASDSDWVVRWCVAEKLGDLNAIQSTKTLIRLLKDPDFHVVKNATKALEKLGTGVISKVIPLFGSPYYKCRESALTVLKGIGESALPDLIKELPNYKWIISNRIVHAIFIIGKQESEEYLIEALTHKKVQKNTVVMLGMIKSKGSIPHIVQLYDNPGLKRVILYSFKLMGKQLAFPVLVQLLQNKLLRINSGKLILKIGPAMLPYLVQGLGSNNAPKKMIIKLVEKIGPQRIMDKLHMLSKNDTEIKLLTRDLRLKYPYKQISSSEKENQSGFWQSLFT